MKNEKSKWYWYKCEGCKKNYAVPIPISQIPEAIEANRKPFLRSECPKCKHVNHIDILNDLIAELSPEELKTEGIL